MDDTPATPEAIDNALQAEQLRLLFRFSVVGHLATLLVIFILGGILWQDLARPALFMWFVATSLTAIGRYLLYKAFLQRNPPAEESRLWEGRFIGGTILAGVCWAMIGSFLLPDAARIVQRLSVVMLVTLLMTGAVAYYAPHRFAYKIMAFFGLVPLAVTLGMSGDRNQMFLSGLILVLAAMLPYVHERVHKALVESLNTRRARESLNTELVEERTRLRKATAALREETTERRKAQEGELLAAQKLRIHFERTTLAVLEWDVEGGIVEWNPAAETICGFPSHDAIGKTVAVLLSTEEER
jgi:PAS domain-containing protein